MEERGANFAAESWHVCLAELPQISKPENDSRRGGGFRITGLRSFEESELIGFDAILQKCRRGEVLEDDRNALECLA